MNTVPQMISTKDLAYLSDMFEWNYTAFKQINHFISEVEDTKVKEILERLRNMHEDHMNFMISILKKEEYEEECDCEECNCDLEESDYDDIDEEDLEDEE